MKNEGYYANRFLKINKKIEDYILNKEIITTKEVVNRFVDEIMKDGDITQEGAAARVRFKISSMKKDGLIERVSMGVYRVLPTDSFSNQINPNYDSNKKPQQSNFLRSDFQIKNEIDFYDLLDSLYKGKWSFSNVALKRRIGISEQMNRKTTININASFNNRIESLINLADEINIKLNIAHYVNDSKFDIELFSIYELISSELFDPEQNYMIKKYIEYSNKDVFELIYFIGINYFGEAKKENLWMKINLDRENKKKFIHNFKSMLREEVFNG